MGTFLSSRFKVVLTRRSLSHAGFVSKVRKKTKREKERMKDKFFVKHRKSLQRLLYIKQRNHFLGAHD